MIGEQADRLDILARGEELEGADPDMARGDTRQHRAGEGGVAKDEVAGRYGGKRPRRRDAERLHRFAHDVFAQHRPDRRAAVAVARVGRRPGTLQLDVVTPALRIDRFAQQERAAIAELRREMAELVAGIGLSQRLSAWQNLVARKDRRRTLDTDVVVLATGVRERPRSARLVPGDRPAGVYTTGQVQQLTALYGQRVGNRAVIVGAEHVSMSAVITLRHAGCDIAAMVTSKSRHESHPLLVAVTVKRHRVPLLTGVSIASIIGRPRVQRVLLSDGSEIDCDTVVFTGDWYAEHEVARTAGITVDMSNGAITTDSRFATSAPRVFAIGNVVHPARASGTCANDGLRLARHLLSLPSLR